MKISKLSKKIVIIGTSILGIILFLGIFIAIFPQLTYIASGVKNAVEEIITEDTVVDNESVADENGNYIIGGYQERIVYKLDNSYDLVIEPNGYLTQVLPPVSIFVASDKGQNLYDPDERVVCYEAGTISGTIREQIDPYSGDINIVTVPEGTKYYIVVYEEYESADSYIAGGIAGWYDSGEVVRYFTVEDKVYIISDDYVFLSTAVTSGVGERVKDSDTDYEKSLLEDNVVLLFDKDYNPVDMNTYWVATQNLYYISYYYFTSSKGVDFRYYNFNETIQFMTDLSGYTEIDDYRGFKIYENDQKDFKIVTREGFIQTVVYQPPLENSKTAMFLYDDKSTFLGVYSSSCMGYYEDTDVMKYYAFENLSSDDLVKVGVVNSLDVYEKKNREEDPYTKKVYDEDYIVFEQWKYNELMVDDIHALTYVEYLTYHPVVYIKDVYGNYLRYTSTDFSQYGDCTNL